MIKKILICAMVLGAIWVAEACFPAGVAAAATAVFAARTWRWPQVPVASYFTTAQVALPATAAVAGIGLATALQVVPAPDSALYFTIGFVAWLLLVWMFAGVPLPRTLLEGPPPVSMPVSIIAACVWLALGLAMMPLHPSAATTDVEPVAAQPIASPAQPLCYRHGLAYSLGWGVGGRICGTAAWPAVTAPPAKTPMGSSTQNSTGAKQ